jgi:hypothetical protein
MSAPAAAVSPDGKRTALAWMDKRRDGRDADVYWTLAAGLSISSDGPIGDSTAGSQNHPQVAFGPDGKVAYAVWEDERSGTMQVYGTSSALKARSILLSGSGRASFPHVAAGGNGVVAVVYETDRRAVEFTLFPAK